MRRHFGIAILQLSSWPINTHTYTPSHIQTDCPCCWLWPCPSVSSWPWVFLGLCDALVLWVWSVCRSLNGSAGENISLRIWASLVLLVLFLHTPYCLHAVCLRLWFLKIFFISTPLMSQCLMKNKWAVVKSPIVHLMPYFSSLMEGRKKCSFVSQVKMWICPVPSFSMLIFFKTLYEKIKRLLTLKQNNKHAVIKIALYKYTKHFEFIFMKKAYYKQA